MRDPACNRESGTRLLTVQVTLVPGLYPEPGVYARPGVCRRFYASSLTVSKQYEGDSVSFCFKFIEVYV